MDFYLGKIFGDVCLVIILLADMDNNGAVLLLSRVQQLIAGSRALQNGLIKRNLFLIEYKACSRLYSISSFLENARVCRIQAAFTRFIGNTSLLTILYGRRICSKMQRNVQVTDLIG